MFCKVLVALLVLCVSTDAFDYCTTPCRGGVPHTMCRFKAGACSSEWRGGLTKEEKEIILDLHNQLRAKVAKGQEKEPTADDALERGPQPPAANMNELVWDDEMAEIAQRWADQSCTYGGHDQCRDSMDGTKVGQNRAMVSGGSFGTVDRHEKIKMMVQGWYDEVKNMQKSIVGSFTQTPLPTGHYTQLVWAETTRVGCGLAHQGVGTNSFHLELVCNYKSAGNWLSEPVYKQGATSSLCAAKSDKYGGLCRPEKGDKLKTDPGAPNYQPTESKSDASSPGGTKVLSFTLKPGQEPPNQEEIMKQMGLDGFPPGQFNFKTMKVPAGQAPPTQEEIMKQMGLDGFPPGQFTFKTMKVPAGQAPPTQEEIMKQIGLEGFPPGQFTLKTLKVPAGSGVPSNFGSAKVMIPEEARRIFPGMRLYKKK